MFTFGGRDSRFIFFFYVYIYNFVYTYICISHTYYFVACLFHLIYRIHISKHFNQWGSFYECGGSSSRNYYSQPICIQPTHSSPLERASLFPLTMILKSFWTSTVWCVKVSDSITLNFCQGLNELCGKCNKWEAMSNMLPGDWSQSLSVFN